MADMMAHGSAREGAVAAPGDDGACTTLLHLQPELLVLVAARLDALKDRAALAVCCRTLRSAARELWGTWYGFGPALALRPLRAAGEGPDAGEAQPVSGAKLFRVPDDQLLEQLGAQDCNPLVEQARRVQHLHRLRATQRPL